VAKRYASNRLETRETKERLAKRQFKGVDLAVRTHNNYCTTRRTLNVMQTYFFADEYGRPWPAGTILRVPSLTNHTGAVGYHPSTGLQVMLQNSKRYGRKVATRPEEFNEGRPYEVVSVPSTPEEGARIVQRAWSEVHTGGAWSWLDNCQDFTSRAVTGKSGSPTRDFLVIVAVLVGVGVALAAD
jgi:hypothetical protein